MKYIRGNTTTFRSDPIDKKGDGGTSITLIHNYGIGDYRTPYHCLILEGRKGSAVILLETDEDRELLASALQDPPSYHDEPVRVGLYDSAYLVMDAYHGYLEISIGEVRVYVDNEDVKTLGMSL